MVSRREYLKTVGALGLGSAVAGCSSNPDAERFSPTTSTSQSPSTAPETDSSLTMLHAVEDLGMDPTGSEPIDDILDGAYAEETVVVFPPGEYLLTEMMDWDQEVSHFGLVGAGESHTDVQFVFPPGNNGKRFRMLQITSGTHHTLRNFSIQQTDDDVTSADIWLANHTGALIEDVEWLGRTPTDDVARNQLLLFDCTSVEGVNVARRVYMREGAAIPGYPDGVAGVRIAGRSVGEIRLVDCHIEQRGSSSFRATHTRGVLRVEGGLFKNNDNTNMRISGGDHPTKRSWIKGATVIVDADNLNDHAQSGDSLESPEGLRIDSTDNGWSDVLIEDCDFIYKSSPQSRGIITCPTWGGHGGFTVRNCRIQNDTTVQTIYADAVDTSVAEKPWSVILDNVSITGSCPSQPKGAAISLGANRNGSEVVGCCLSLPNGDVGGILITDSTDCLIADTGIGVGGPPTIFDNADVTVRNISDVTSCASTSISD